MANHRRLKLSLLIVAFTAVFFTAGILFFNFFNLLASKTAPQKEKSAVSGSSSNQRIQPPPTRAATPTSPVVSSTIQTDETEWATYRDEEFKFEVQYPKKGWGLTSKMGSPVLSYHTVQEPINLYTERAVPTQGPVSAPITMAVYEKPAIEIVEWLSVSYGENLLIIQKGGLDTVLERAYAGEIGVFSYNESQINGTTIYEVGGAWSNGYAISYATFFVTENLPYVYEVSFELPYYGTEFNVEPSDNEYIELYKRMISSFQFLE